MRTPHATMRPIPVVIALGSNLGDRRWHLRAAIHLLMPTVQIVRLSSVWEAEPLGCPPGSGTFLNMALSGLTYASPGTLLSKLHAIEDRVGRRRRQRNEPRRLDLDLIFFGAYLSGGAPTIPHPRYGQRAFVLKPLEEIGINWTVAGARVASLEGEGNVRRVGPIY